MKLIIYNSLCNRISNAKHPLGILPVCSCHFSNLAYLSFNVWDDLACIASHSLPTDFQEKGSSEIMLFFKNAQAHLLLQKQKSDEAAKKLQDEIHRMINTEGPFSFFKRPFKLDQLNSVY